jgi:PadR family transcriptional regulator PadR
MPQTPRITLSMARVLAALLSEPDTDQYGLELMRQTGLASGTLYPILARLQQAGWVEAKWEEIDPVEAGRPARRYYRLTALGATTAQEALDTLRAQTEPAKRPQPRPGSKPATGWARSPQARVAT